MASASLNVENAKLTQGLGDFPKVVLPSAHGSEAELYLFGGCVTSWKVADKDLLFVRPDAVFNGQKPISGGVPHCFPQFGPGALQQFAKENPCEVDFEETIVGSEEEASEETVEIVLRKALTFYGSLQAEDGHWLNDYGGPLFLIPGLVIALHIMSVLSTALPEEHNKEIRRYLYNHQNIDGGWGLHIEGHSTMFCTVLNYVSLRLLGEDVEEDDDSSMMNKARTWILDHGGATYIPSWGKLWLSVLGVYEWDGNNPLPPELWLLPHALPIHSGCMWCHCQPLLKKWPLSKLRHRALITAMKHIQYEDENTNYICIGPVNKVLNMLCCWINDPNSDSVKRHISRIKDNLWVAEDGLKMKGYNGSQLWDVALAVQAIMGTNLSREYRSMLVKAHEFIKSSQVRRDSSGHIQSWYRHMSKGGWPFSTPDNGWIVSDCTAEGLKASLLLSQLPPDVAGEPLELERLCDAVDLLLSLQNSNGGFASYELTRSYAWLEMINPAETFGDIIIDYQYHLFFPPSTQVRYRSLPRHKLAVVKHRA